MKKLTRSTLSLLLAAVLTATLLPAQAAKVSPRYTGISNIDANLEIKSGRATCRGTVEVKSNYTADLVLELKRDGTVIKTWTDSGTGKIELNKTYYVTSGHDYELEATATVYNSSNKVVETPSYSASKSY